MYTIFQTLIVSWRHRKLIIFSLVVPKDLVYSYEYLWLLTKRSELYSVVRLFQILVAFTSLLTKITGERHDVDLHLLSSCNPLSYGN